MTQPAEAPPEKLSALLELLVVETADFPEIVPLLGFLAADVIVPIIIISILSITWFACTIVIRMMPRSAEPPGVMTRSLEALSMLVARSCAAISGTQMMRHSGSAEARTSGSAHAKC